MLLLERNHVARAHHTVLVLPAFADTDAAQRGTREAAAIVRKSEVCFRLPRIVRSAQTEILVQLVRINELARVHAAARIPDRLELPECADQLIAEHAILQLGARLAITMLARQRSAHADNEVR